MVRVPGRSYVVGGAVRDRLLGLPISDRDHVVVGATAAEMEAAGFKPVGRDFPVFLHPETKEEYALARTERKVRAGYTGFVFDSNPDVTLDEDLGRRDLTINAMAEDDGDGRLIDPFGGAADLDRRIFRHVGPAFIEDPVRILRLARFAARFSDFALAPETSGLIDTMVRSGEVDALVPERVWQEMSRGLGERRPSRLFDVLASCGALARVAPLVDAWWTKGGVVLARALDAAAEAGVPLDVRFALVAAEAGDEGLSEIVTTCEALRVPREVRDLAVLAARDAVPLVEALGRGAAAAGDLVTIMTRADAFRRTARYRALLEVVARRPIGDGAARPTLATAALDAALAVDASAVARENAYDPARIFVALQQARTSAVTRELQGRNGVAG